MYNELPQLSYVSDEDIYGYEEARFGGWINLFLLNH